MLNQLSSLSLSTSLFRIKDRKVTVEHILLLGILLFGLYLRLYDLGKAPFWVDESISSLAGKNILLKGIPLFDSGFIYSSALLFHYIQALSFFLFGLNDFAARLPSVLFGMLTILLAYLIGKEYSKYGGLMAAALTAIFFLEVSFSREARYYQLFQLAFFATLYFVYKIMKGNDSKKSSPEKKKSIPAASKKSLFSSISSNIYLYAAIISFLIAVDTQIGGMVLAPFLLWGILQDRAKGIKDINRILQLSKLQLIIILLVIAVFIYNAWKALSIQATTISNLLERAGIYLSYLSVRKHLIPFSIAGLIWAYFKNKRFTLSLLVPSIVLLFLAISVEMYAFRYVYFFQLLIVLYTAVLFALLYDKFGKIILVPFVLLLIVPSNLLFPYSYSNILLPHGLDYRDSSSPTIDLKNLPPGLLSELKDPDAVIITYFSPPVEWYIKKPTYVVPFSLTGRGADEISYNSGGMYTDRYSGVRTLNIREGLPQRQYYLIEQNFATAKLVPWQQEDLNVLKENCTIEFENQDVNVYRCR